MQNGQDHSGRSGDIGFFTDENINRAVTVIGKIAQFSSSPEWKDTVTVIQLLNEPILWGDQYQHRLNRLKDYYESAYHEVRKHNNMAIVAVHDAFIDHSNWYYFKDLSDEYYWVMLDTHLYQVFGDQWKSKSCDDHHYHPCSYTQLATSNKKLWTIVGEFSLATPADLHCDKQDFFARQQIGAFEKGGSGWFMWAHDHGQAWSEWSFKDAYNKNWIKPNGQNVLQC